LVLAADHRHGRLDWQVVANASLDRIIANVDVQALQKVVDPLTFSEVRLVETQRWYHLS
jgi:hypothetical protein